MNKYLGFLLLLILTITACSKATVDEPVTLIATDSPLGLSLDENTSNISSHLEYYFDESMNRELLFSLNGIKNELQIYDLNQGQQINSLPFAIEGDRGVGNISAFYVHDLDSILLFPSAGNRLFLTDSEAKNIKRINYSVPEGYGNANVSSTFFAAQPYLNDGKLIAKSLYQGSYSTISNKELSVRKVSYTIDLKSGEVNSAKHSYPNDYWAEVKKHFQFSVSSSENGTAYSFWGDHNLYLSKDQNQEWITKSAQSECLREAWEALPLSGSRMDRTKYFATSAHYGNIIWDPYRSVYYRFCYPKVDVEDEEDLRLVAQFPTTFSIMILDKELNVLGEQYFDNKTALVTSNVFVGKAGLYISVNHPDNAGNKEDFLRFQLYQLNR